MIVYCSKCNAIRHYIDWPTEEQERRMRAYLDRMAEKYP